MMREQDRIKSGTIAVISDIQRYCVHDGPGLRTTVFFKGCPLRCKWCHNPETFRMMPEIIYDQDACIGCGKCAEVCKSDAIYISDEKLITDRLKCTDCGECAKVCPSEARRLIGKFYTVDELREIVSRDLVFYMNSGGGVTLSGGEVTLQSIFAEQLIISLKEDDIHITIETCGYASTENFRRVILPADLILFDIKHPNADMHREYTGVDDKLIRQNLRDAVDKGKKIIVRYPLIPGVNNSTREIETMGNFCKAAGIEEIHLMPFHQAGETKWEGLDKDYSFKNQQGISLEEITKTANILTDFGFMVSVGGSGQ